MQITAFQLLILWLPLSRCRPEMGVIQKTILLLGHTGKLGSALCKAMSSDYLVIGKNSNDFDAANFAQVTELIYESQPDIIINSVAFMGIDACELDPVKAQRINTLLPGHLAKLAAKLGITLVHFSTDAVFNDEKQDFYNEDDATSPLNLYGITKFGGECLVRSGCENHYVFRVPQLFGKCGKQNQFVEKMLTLIQNGQNKISVSADIISSPTYSCDVAEQVRQMLLHKAPFGTYHLANEGKASLHELMAEILSGLKIDVIVEKAYFTDFPAVGRKNICTPLKSLKTKNLRPWREAVTDYCRSLEQEGLKYG